MKIEEYLDLLVDINCNQFNLQDKILGSINFLLNKIKIKKIELVIVKKEILEEKDNNISNTQDIYEFEILDGYPISNKQIPLRLFLAGVPNLTPTYEKINNKISV